MLAPFAALIADPSVTDIFVNGSAGLFVDRGAGAVRQPGWRASEREVRELATALMSAGDRHVDDANPCVDVRLHDGIRVHAVLSPIATSGTVLSIRIPRLTRARLSELADRGMLVPEIEERLRVAVGARANFLISGAGGVGKTTLLSALLAEAHPGERIVTIEDVAELRIEHPHHVALEARQANLEGAGEISLARLVREALRMKPDRLVVGECRGGEVRELLSALNTGHDGGAGTVHANGLTDVPARLEALGALAGLDDIALARQVVSAMDFVVHLEQGADGVRRVVALGEFRIEQGRLAVSALWEAPAADERTPATHPSQRVDRPMVTAPAGSGASEPARPSVGDESLSAEADERASFDEIVRGYDRVSSPPPPLGRGGFIPQPRAAGRDDRAA
ncbi:TadA family conjugal transfer-associated ATPase [Microbacterium gorillae]|uniref:TadA family conjugal transfer-associated ATPase n=1 Tax=Microbacterium gorillae TaxID=1231063 RepID=UPI000B2DD423|nr:TadA family conjugal transfer-associated ATPase [Microbacterium gorillae]